VTAVRIELVIDEIVLHGFDPRQRHAIGDAIQQHLSQLALDRSQALGALTSRDVVHSDAGVISTLAGASPAAAGAGIARAVIGALGGGT